MPPQIILLMGVAGSGKTTTGRTLAAKLGWEFTDADDLHPPGNIAKLSAGIALTDTDRAPWLAALRARIDDRLAAGAHAVLACSALKESYRARLVSDPSRIGLVHLQGTREQLAARLANRTGHFAPASLLESQLAALEAPRDALTLDIAASPENLAETIRRHYAL